MVCSSSLAQDANLSSLSQEFKSPTDRFSYTRLTMFCSMLIMNLICVNLFGFRSKHVDTVDSPNQQAQHFAGFECRYTSMEDESVCTAFGKI